MEHRNEINARDLFENVNSLKTKLIAMAEYSFKDDAELAEYIDRIDRVLKV